MFICAVQNLYKSSKYLSKHFTQPNITPKKNIELLACMKLVTEKYVHVHYAYGGHLAEPSHSGRAVTRSLSTQMTRVQLQVRALGSD